MNDHVVWQPRVDWEYLYEEYGCTAGGDGDMMLLQILLNDASLAFDEAV